MSIILQITNDCDSLEAVVLISKNYTIITQHNKVFVTLQRDLVVDHPEPGKYSTGLKETSEAMSRQAVNFTKASYQINNNQLT